MGNSASRHGHHGSGQTASSPSNERGPSPSSPALSSPAASSNHGMSSTAATVSGIASNRRGSQSAGHALSGASSSFTNPTTGGNHHAQGSGIDAAAASSAATSGSRALRASQPQELPKDLDPGHKIAAAALYAQEARVDHGHLLPLSNIYPNAPQDWLHDVVQKLIVKRKLAPFYRGLEDYNEPDDEADFDVAAIDAALNDVGDEQGKKWRKKLYKDSDRKAEANMYRKASECPICFLYYPPLINTSRCCDQPICTECFVQIKRADATTTNLISEPAACPYCVESNFGVTYIPPIPSRRTGLGAPKHSKSNHANAADGSEEDDLGPVGSAAARRKSVSHTAAEVVTVDFIQADWQAKLASVQAVAARRAARRVVFRQQGEQLIPVGFTSGGREIPNSIVDDQGRIVIVGGPMLHVPVAGTMLGQHPATSNLSPAEHHALFAGSPSRLLGRHSRRTRDQDSNASPTEANDPRLMNMGVDLEELMVMEAMRLSMLDEEERRKKAEKEAKAAAKKEGKKKRGPSGSEAGPSGLSGATANRLSFDALRSSLDRSARNSIDRDRDKERTTANRAIASTLSDPAPQGSASSSVRGATPDLSLHAPISSLAPNSALASSSSAQPSLSSPATSTGRPTSQAFLKMPPMARNDSSASMSHVNVYLPPPMVPSKASASTAQPDKKASGVRQLTAAEIDDLL